MNIGYQSVTTLFNSFAIFMHFCVQTAHLNPYFYRVLNSVHIFKPNGLKISKLVVVRTQNVQILWLHACSILYGCLKHFVLYVKLMGGAIIDGHKMGKTYKI